MKHLHVLLTEEQYQSVKKFAKKHDVSLATAIRFIIQWWREDGPKESPQKKDS